MTSETLQKAARSVTAAHHATTPVTGMRGINKKKGTNTKHELKIKSHSRLKRASIPISIKRKLSAMPCAICGTVGDTEVDHVVAVAVGGFSNSENLQPLCRVCNVLKHSLKTNDSVLKWIAHNPEQFAFKQRLRRERWALIRSGEWF